MKCIVCLTLFLSFYFSQADKLNDYYNQFCSKSDPSQIIQCCKDRNIAQVVMQYDLATILANIPQCETVNVPIEPTDINQSIKSACSLSDQDKQELINCFGPFVNQYFMGNAELVRIIEDCLSK